MFLLIGMVKIVVVGWVFWFIYVGFLEFVVLSMLYDLMENVIMVLLIIILIVGYVFIFFVVCCSSRNVFSFIYS